MYCDLDDIRGALPEERIRELTDDDNVGMIDQGHVDKAIEWAGSYIDSFIGAKYEVPLATVPDLIKHLSVDFTIWRLYSRRLDDDLPANINERYKHATNVLKSIRSGELSLESSEEAASAYRTNKQTSDRLFNKDLLDTF